MNSRLLAPGRWAVLALAAGFATIGGAGEAIAVDQQPTAIAVAVPETATLGDMVTVQARLVAAGGPIENALIAFAIPATFMNTDGDAIVTRGKTDSEGLAVASFQVRITGSLEVKAIYDGSDAYAPSTASGPITVSGSEQLYVPDVGIRLRGLNSAPIGHGNRFTPWILSGWPIGALLVLIWSLYALAVFFMSEIAAEADHEPGTSASSEVEQ